MTRTNEGKTEHDTDERARARRIGLMKAARRRIVAAAEERAARLDTDPHSRHVRRIEDLLRARLH